MLLPGAPKVLIQSPSNQQVFTSSFQVGTLFVTTRQEGNVAQQFLALWYPDLTSVLIVSEDGDGNLYTLGNTNNRYPTLDKGVIYDDSHLWKIGDGLAVQRSPGAAITMETGGGLIFTDWQDQQNQRWNLHTLD